MKPRASMRAETILTKVAKKTIPIPTAMSMSSSKNRKKRFLPHRAKKLRATTSATSPSRIQTKAAKVAPKCVAPADTLRALLPTALVAAVVTTIVVEAVAASKRADLAAAED